MSGQPARGAWAAYKSPYDFDIGSSNSDSSLRSISGGTVWMPDLVRLGTFFRENPPLFTPTMSAANFYNAYVGSRRNYDETIDAAYLMGTAALGRASVRAGLRWEETATDALQFDPRTPAELAAAGFPEAQGRATTIPGLQCQYFSSPKVHLTNRYDNLFPSASVKYRFTRNFDFQFGFSTTIRRPTFRDIAGVWSINDDALTVTAPNPALEPEKSRNFAGIPKANLVPHSGNFGLSYAYRGFNVYANTQWRDTYPRTISGNPRFNRHRANVDVGGGYRISQRHSFFFYARNLLNEPFITLERVGANPAVTQLYEVNGTNWTFGVKAVF